MMNEEGFIVAEKAGDIVGFVVRKIIGGIHVRKEKPRNFPVHVN